MNFVYISQKIKREWRAQLPKTKDFAKAGFGLGVFAGLMLAILFIIVGSFWFFGSVGLILAIIFGRKWWKWRKLQPKITEKPPLPNNCMHVPYI